MEEKIKSFPEFAIDEIVNIVLIVITATFTAVNLFVWTTDPNILAINGIILALINYLVSRTIFFAMKWRYIDEKEFLIRSWKTVQIYFILSVIIAFGSTILYYLTHL